MNGKLIDNQLVEIFRDAEIDELFNEAATHGDAYFQGYTDGFWAGCHNVFKNLNASFEQIDKEL